MSSTLLQPPSHLPPHLALHLSQQAPLLLKSQPDTISSLQLPLFSSAETPETWIIYENLMLSCLRTGDDKSAYQCLQRLSDRFGPTNERVMGLRGMYQEAVAEDDAALKHVLAEYDQILEENPTNTPILKRRIALLQSISKPDEAISALVQLLEASPTDVEAWAELADLYQSQSMYNQAIFSLEEVLLITPNAWNIHAWMGEVIYLSALAAHSGNEGHMDKTLIDAMRYFCRSIELCDGYLRGYYGLKLVTDRLLSILPRTMRSSSAVSSLGAEDVPPPTLSTVQKLNDRATAELAEVVCAQSVSDKAFKDAVRELLNQEAQQIKD